MEYGFNSSSSSVVNSTKPSKKAIAATTASSSSITSTTWENSTSLGNLLLLANSNNKSSSKSCKQGNATTSSDKNAEINKSSTNDSYSSLTTTDSTLTLKSNDELALIAFNGNSYKINCTNSNVKSLQEKVNLSKKLASNNYDDDAADRSGPSLGNFSTIINKFETMQLAEPIREFMKNFKAPDALTMQHQQQQLSVIPSSAAAVSLQLSLPPAITAPTSSSSSTNYLAELVVSTMASTLAGKAATDQTAMSVFKAQKKLKGTNKTKTVYSTSESKAKNTTNAAGNKTNKKSEAICLTSSLTGTATGTSMISVVDNNVTTKNTTTAGTNGTGSVAGNDKIIAKGFRIPSDVLDDLASRFIINVPDMELSNLIRICFQIELAHWFYLDFFCAVEESLKLQPCGMKQFTIQLFQHIPFLTHHLAAIDKILEDWKNYKLSVPTYGAILISEDLNHCLLVQSYFAKSSWGFPKGKVNETEDPIHCAAREVFEETGYDITGLIVPKDYIEAVINYQYTRLYIVCDVSLQTQFSPRTRNEIKCCDWFRVDDLPTNKNDAISKAKLGLNANSFFMILPFVKRLKKWINQRRSKLANNNNGGAMEGMLNSSPAVKGMAVINSSNNKSGKKNKDDGGNFFKDSSNSNSKRQRHKSMGDLDGMKSVQNSNTNNNSSNNKNASIHANNNNNNSIAGGGAGDGSHVKRQLFHSQSHCGGAGMGGYNQIMNAFDMGHKVNGAGDNNSKMSKAAEKRMRAKSQSDKMMGLQTPNNKLLQVQPGSCNKNNSQFANKENNNRNKNRSPKAREQHHNHNQQHHQRALHASNLKSSSEDSADDHGVMALATPTHNKNKLRRATTSLPLQYASPSPSYTQVNETSTPPPALSEFMSYHRQKKDKESKAVSVPVQFLKNTLPEQLHANAPVCNTADKFNVHLETPSHCSVQNLKQEYAGAMQLPTKLQFEFNNNANGHGNNINGLFAAADAAAADKNNSPMGLQMVRQQSQQPPHTGSPLIMPEQCENHHQTTNFTPNIASWLNFTFTKNFISNVFL